MQKINAIFLAWLATWLNRLAPAVANLPVDEQRKRGFLALLLLIIIPTLLFFGAMNLWTDGFSIDVMLGLLGTTTAFGILLAIRSPGPLQAAYRAGVAYTLFMLIMLLANGGAAGVSYFWFYFYPLAVYFLFGYVEGFFWVLLSWSAAMLIAVVNLGPYHYPLAIGLRFVISYTLVCVLAHGMELSRQRYYGRLFAEKLALEAALQQVKTLQGLLPICASCKKIRDDGGYWHQVESYMHNHTGIEFSHSICPDCRSRLYPTVSKPRADLNPAPPQRPN